MSIVYFLIMLCVIILFHEFGHFLIAKLNGIKVVEFTLGMGPKLLSFTKGDTMYCIRLFLIGGACIFEQEDGLQTMKDGEAVALPGPETVPDSVREKNTISAKKALPFPEASVWARIATVVAGPLFNFLLAFLFSLIIVGYAGSDPAKISGIIEGYPAQEAGLREGDRIVKLNDESIKIYREVTLFSLMNTKGKAVKVTYERDGKRYTTKIQPKYDEEDGRYLIGMYGGGYEKGNAWDTIVGSFYEVRYWIKYTFKSLIMLFTGKASVNDMSGPVGIAEVVDEVVEVSKPLGFMAVLINLLNFAVLLSANLGVMNLLPLPALDGGRLIFLLIEAITHKKIPPEKEGLVHLIGMVLLILLMIFVFFNDIRKIIG